MTPHTNTRVHVHVPRRTLRRSIAVVAAVSAIAGTPLVAQALDDHDVAARPEAGLGQPAPVETPAIPDLGATIEMPATVAPLAVAERVVDPATAVLTAAYAWDERGPRVVALQQILGMTADGWYTYPTLHAHRSMLEAFDLPTGALPAPALPPGTTAEQWAALRECESNGNYSITNPSGKYRGAYQFDRPTWNSVAERHAPHLVGVDPAAASPADQDAMARALYGDRGASPWPLCGRHLS
jgi:hypothetical protein